MVRQMRIYRCNRCGTTFTNKPAYTMFKSAKFTNDQMIPPHWVDLCPTCTTAFESFLGNNQNEGGEADE